MAIVMAVAPECVVAQRVLLDALAALPRPASQAYVAFREPQFADTLAVSSPRGRPSR